MCDLFTLSASTEYSAPRALPVFAARASRNMDGWGIGFFKRQRAYVEKSAVRAYDAGRLHDSFQRLTRIISSRIIIAHVRFRTSGPIDECHAHPFVLRSGGYDWLFAHNGKAPLIEAYHSDRAGLDCAISDSAKTFEYLLDRMALDEQPPADAREIFTRLGSATRSLLQHYPGRYNYLLSNGHVLFAFSNHRQFLLLKGSANLEHALLLTTVEKGLSEENWFRISKTADSCGVLLAITGASVILQEDL